MDKELNALRRVAKAARLYQEKIVQQRTLQLASTADQKEPSESLFDLGSIEFELSEALNDWYRTQLRAS